MERLNKKQREILDYLKKVYPDYETSEDLLKDLGYRPEDVLADVMLLKEKELIATMGGYLGSPLGSTYFAISPKGIEKLQETFIARILDTAYNNPWAVIAIIMSVILGLVTLRK